MTDAAHPDQSMEEILQSIKRIIAEEGDAPPTGGSDILELTEFLEEEPASAPAEEVATGFGASDFSGMSLDEIMAAPMPALEGAALADAMDFSPPAMEAIAEPEPERQAEPVWETPVAVPPPPPPPPPPPLPASEPLAAFDDTLISEATRAASVAALGALANLSHTAETALPTEFRSGHTVEDLVTETLRPLLKDWLDTHLVGIVERLVEKEIRRLTLR